MNTATRGISVRSLSGGGATLSMFHSVTDLMTRPKIGSVSNAMSSQATLRSQPPGGSVSETLHVKYSTSAAIDTVAPRCALRRDDCDSGPGAQSCFVQAAIRTGGFA